MNDHDSNNIPEPLKSLLFAALSDDGEAIKFYLSWREKIDFENISFAEYELLPKVYSSLRRARFTDDLTLKIKGISRRTWLENEIYKKELTEFFRVFDQAGVEFILLTKEPLAFSLLNGETNFSFRNFQILSRRPITTEILTNLEKAGWEPAEKYGDISLDKEEVWFNHSGHLRIGVKLKSRIFAKDIWNVAETIEFSGKRVKVLSSADYLLQILETEFLSAEKTKSAMWILSAVFTLQNNRNIDWERLVRQSQKIRLNFALTEMLDEVAQFAPLDSFSKVRDKFLESPHNKMQKLFSAYRSLKKSYKKNGEDFSFLGFAGFLQRHWKTKSVFELPWQIGKRFLKI